MATKTVKRGLGKGLDSIIPAKVSPTKEIKIEEKHIEGQVENVNITKVEPNRNQPRKTFDEDKLLELADSIKQFGIINPIIVKDRGDHYEIVGGERRWRAAKKAGLKEVPVIIKDLSEQEIAEGATKSYIRTHISPHISFSLSQNMIPQFPNEVVNVL